MSWPLLHHPAFQSLLLPALLGALCTLALHRVAGGAGRPWSGFGAASGLVLALLWWPGLDWPAGTLVQKWPWAVVLALLAALVLQALRRAPGPARASARGARRPALPWGLRMVVLVVVPLGLAAWAVAGGSMLLAQLALMVPASAGVPLLWAWARPGSGPRLTLIALLPLGLAVLALLLMTTVLGSTAAGPAPDGATDDPYYTPRW